LPSSKTIVAALDPHKKQRVINQQKY